MAKWDPRLIALMRAAEEGLDSARKLVEADSAILDLRTGLGETALHYLAVENRVEAVQRLIDLGASVNVTNKFGRTPLQEAKYIGASDVVAVLTRAGADPSLGASWSG
jgi:ankyrin repeat protein